MWSALETACKLSSWVRKKSFSQQSTNHKIIKTVLKKKKESLVLEILRLLCFPRNIPAFWSIHLSAFPLSTFPGREKIWARLFPLCPRDSWLVPSILKSEDYVCPCTMYIRSIPLRTEIKSLQHLRYNCCPSCSA